MPQEVIGNVYANFGLFGTIVVAFFVLIYWVLKTSEKREEKLYKVIDTLSSELPEIRKSLNEIQTKVCR